ncbi:RHS repeat-associated core domain-containing protein [Lentzea sp. NPDC005914]|uniref:RHS repeat-associated core domain-containing protein n=1 Tax=Lentzea sp. NPDC005914 TaxID=3154572 RepID=UPI0033CA5E65
MRHASVFRAARRPLCLLLVLVVALPFLGGSQTPYGTFGALPLGASTSAPEQRTGTADGSSHETSAESTRINRDLPKRDQPRPKNAVADRPDPLPEVKTPSEEDRKVTPKVEKPVLPAIDKDAVERPQDRTETTRTFDNPDGSRTLRLHTGPANVRQPDGSWLPVDLTLVPSGGRLKPKVSPIGLSLGAGSADGSLVQIDLDGDHGISYGMRDVTDVRGEASGPQVTYRGVRPGTDLRLTATGGGVKEDLVLASAAAPSSYSFTVKLKRLSPRVDVLGGVELVDGDKIVATIPAGVMDDAAGVRSTGVKYGLDKIADDTWVLRVDADQTWLRDPARKFPVVLDPTTERPETDADAMFVRSNGFGGANGGLEVGRVEGNPVSRTYLHFNGAQNALRNRYVVSASLAASNVYSTNCTPRSVSVFEVTQPWSSSMRWPGAAVGQSLSASTFAYGGAAGTACASPQWAYFALDPDLMTRWTHGSALAHGLSLRMSDETLREGRRFASASTVNKPYLEVRYSPEGASYEATGVTLPSNVKEGKLSVKVTNMGSSTWSAGGGVHFGFIIKQGAQEVARRNGYRADVAPMATHQFVDLPVPALAPGDYDVFLTMFNPDGTDFRDAHGVPYGRMPITVFNRAPSTNYQQPGTGATVESLRPTLYAEGVDADNWPGRGLTYKFRICTDVALTQECQETPEWGGQSFSPQLTRWNKTYFWGVKTYDTVDETPFWASPAPLVLTTRVPQPVITSHLAGSPNSAQGPGLDPNIGNYSTVATDVSIATAGPDLTISRTYNSLDPRKDTAFGTGWSSRLDMRLKSDDDHSGNVVITHPTGRQVRYGRNPDGTFGSPSGSTADLVYVPATGLYTLRDTTGAQWRFDALGRLATIVNPAGLTESLNYDTSDRVKTITNNTSGRTLTVAWQGNHVSSVTTQAPEANSSALVWTYTYTGDRLTTVCVPGTTPTCTTMDYADGSHYRSTVLDDRPKTYWRLGETSGDTFANVTARSNGQYAAQPHNVVLGTAGALEGTSDRAATFDGNSSYVTLPDKLTSESMSLAVELWFKTTSQGTLLSYADQGFPAAAGKSTPVLYVGTDGLLYGGFSRRDAGGPRQVVSTQAVNDDQWHHVVLSAAVDVQTLYLDGKKIGEPLAGLIDHKQQTKLTVGAGSGKDWPATNGGNFHFAGSIDEAAVYLHPLGSLAVAEHHAARGKLDQLTTVKLPQDSRQFAKITYDDVNDRVATLLDHTGRTWSLDTPRIEGATRTAVLRGPSNFGDWTYSFDLDNGGRLTSVAHDGATSRNEYNTAGFLSATVDPSGLRTEQTTDARGNVLSSKTCRAAGSCNTSYFSYLESADPLDPRRDKLESTSDARSTDAADTRFRTSYTYDAAGRLTGVSTPAPAGVTVRPSTSVAYATGNEDAVGGGKVPAGLPTTSTGKRGQVTSIGYFANGDQAEVNSPSGLKVRFVYDALGRQKSITSGNAGGGVFGTTTYEYTPRSKVSKTTAPAVQNPITGKTHQQVTEYRYDNNDNILETTVSDVLAVADGGTPSRTTKTAYDAQDRLARMEFPDGGTETHAYSDNGLTETVTDVNGVVWTSQFEERGLLLSRTATAPGADPEDPGASGLVVESHVYDPAGKVRSSDDAMGRKTSFTYYDDGLLATTTRNGYHDLDGNVRDVVLEDRTYDPVGNVAVLVSTGGPKTTQTFDAAGLPLTSTFDPDGLRRAVTYTRDADGNAIRTERRGAADDTRAEVTASEFDASNQVTAEHAYLNANTAFTTRYDRDERGLLSSVTDRRLNTTTFTYDAKGNQVSVTSPAVEAWVGGVRTAGFAGTNTAGRNAFGEQTHTRDAAGSVSVTEYDSMGRTTKVSLPSYTPPGGQPVVHSKRMEYDHGGRLKKSIDGLNRVTSYDHDPYGRVTATTLPQVGETSAVIRANYNRAGDLISSVDPMGIETRSTYDELGRQVSTTEVDRSSGSTLYFTTTTKHDLAGNALSVTNSMNATSSATYNAAGEVLTSTDPTDRVSKSTYDISGRVATTTDPSGLVSSQTYDLLGRPVRSANLVDGTELRASTAEYDPAGNVLKRTSPQGRVSSYAYDALGRLVTQTEKADTTKSIVTSFGYDKLGNRSRFVDGRGNATIYTYTASGLPESTVEPATAATPNAADRTWTTVYDAAGQTTRELKPGGVTVDREFDAQGRLKLERGAGAEATTADRTFGYDLAGRMIKIGGPAGDSGYTYDDRGNLLTSYGAGGSATYTYNGDGTVATRKDVTGDASFTYDKAGRLVSSADPLSGRTVDYGYDAAGRLGVVTDRAVSTWAARRLSYDPLGRQTSDQVQQTVEGGLRVLVGAEYGYDLDGKVTSKKITDTSGSATNTYGYDGAGRLTSWTGPAGTTDYRWDDSGNRVGAGTATFDYDERNRLKSGGGATYTYTPRGTRASVTQNGQTTASSFDAFDRMASAGAVSYRYDSLNRVTDRNGVAFKYQGQTNEAVSDGSRLVSRLPDGTAFSDKAAGSTLKGRMLFADLHGDVIGRFLGGAVDGLRSFDPFGTVTSSSGDASPLGFQGDWTDGTTGSVNMGARWYSPGAGQFVSRDDWTLDPSPSSRGNRYAYTWNDPVNGADPDGHDNIPVLCPQDWKFNPLNIRDYRKLNPGWQAWESFFKQMTGTSECLAQTAGTCVATIYDDNGNLCPGWMYCNDGSTQKIGHCKGYWDDDALRPGDCRTFKEGCKKTSPSVNQPGTNGQRPTVVAPRPPPPPKWWRDAHRYLPRPQFDVNLLPRSPDVVTLPPADQVKDDRDQDTTDSTDTTEDDQSNDAPDTQPTNDPNSTPPPNGIPRPQIGLDNQILVYWYDRDQRYGHLKDQIEDAVMGHDVVISPQVMREFIYLNTNSADRDRYEWLEEKLGDRWRIGHTEREDEVRALTDRNPVRDPATKNNLRKLTDEDARVYDSARQENPPLLLFTADMALCQHMRYDGHPFIYLHPQQQSNGQGRMSMTECK